MGLAYKANVDDMRESPALRIIEMLEALGAEVSYHDPFIPVIPRTREHATLMGRRSVPLDPGSLSAADAVLICTDHTGVNYRAIGEHARLVVDTRNAMATAGVKGDNTVLA